MQAKRLSIWILALLALPAVAQEESESKRLRLILSPEKASNVVFDDDGHLTFLAGPELVFGSGTHFLNIVGHRRYIGVQLTPLTAELRQHFGVDSEVGIMVSRLEENDPAAKAGVEVGDIITGIDGEAVDASSDLTRVIRDREPGETVELEIWRNGASRRIKVAVAERDPYRIVDIRKQGPDSDDGRAFVLPEIRFRGFDPDGKWKEKLHSDWQGVIRLDDIKVVLDRLGDYFSSADWQERVHHIEEMDFQAVEEKMKEVESRLKQLELRITKEERGQEL